jgi:diguanylate cyclase (GGDEF)-like protein
MTRAPASVVRRLRELAVVSVAALAVLAALVTASEVQFRAVYGPERDRLLLADDGLDDLVAGMLDQETGVRGYLASGDRAFLEPYDDGREQVLQGMAQLAAGLRDESGLAAFAELQTRAAEWQQEYGAPTVALASRDSEVATDAPLAQRGKDLFDAFRLDAERLEAHLHRRLADVNAERDRVRVALLGGALALLGLLAAVGGRRVRTTRLLVERPVRLLAEHARAADEGRPGPGPEDVPLEFLPVRAAVDGLVADLSAARRTVAEQQGRLQRAARVTGLLLEQTRLLAATSEAPAIAAATGESALALLEGRRVAVWLEGAGDFRLAYESGWRGERHGLAVTLADAAGCPAERARHFGRVVVDDESGVVAAPVIAEGRALGVVAVVLPEGSRPDSGDLDALQVLLSQGAGALTAARLLARTTELTLRDPLTGLANRRQLERDLAELDRAGDAGVGLLVLDVDHFKHFNDTHGHAAGDDLLRALGDVLAGAVRTGEGGDSVYRYGGEEFVVLLRECRPDTVAPSAERLRETVARRLIAQGVTVSVGAASAGGTTPTAELFGAADTALYAAKAGGRNRVVLAGAAPSDTTLLVAADAGRAG